MDRALIYTQECLRSYDWLKDSRRTLIALANLAQDLLGSTSTFVAGFAASQHSPASLVVLLAAGRIYAQAEADATAFGALPADTTDIITQQGWAAAQSLTISTSGLTSGQSQWVLIEAGFSQTDTVDSDDPTAGVLNFYNSANPQQPLNGPGGDGEPLNTDRQALATISVVYGTAASTGAEVPPNPSSGAVPLYLIDLAYGQSTITNAEILVAGPNAGENVPNNYPAAPFIQGLSALANPRTRLTGNTTYYVNQSTGSDSNTGLGVKAAWQTLQHAWNYLIQNIDSAGYTITIQLAGTSGSPQTYTAGVACSGAMVGQHDSIGFSAPGGDIPSVIFSGGSAAGSVAISCSAGNCFSVGNGASIQINGYMTLEASSSAPNAGFGIFVYQSGYVYLGSNITFGACYDSHMGTENSGLIFASASYAIAGGAGSHWFAVSSGSSISAFAGITISLAGTPAFSAAFANANFGGQIFCSGLTFSGSATGVRYLVDYNGLIYTNSGGATYLPGSTGGTTGSHQSPLYE